MFGIANQWPERREAVAGKIVTQHCESRLATDDSYGSMHWKISNATVQVRQVTRVLQSVMT